VSLSDKRDVFEQMMLNARATLEEHAERAGFVRGTRAFCLATAGPCKAFEQGIYEIDGRCVFCLERHDED
jgi:hypothetical protein